MTDRNSALEGISGQLGDHIVAVKGTLELVDASVAEDDLHDLLLKAVDRMDAIQRLVDEMFVVFRKHLEKEG
ncbi:MAG: hypothetical protein M0Z79_02845 [Nitrospiraceae bacterium]|nr:hypothetical protein [Nitrospiraceae bacterium]